MKLFPNKIDLRSRDNQSIIFTNMILIALSVVFQWNVSELIFMFWIENIVLGFYGILKLLLFKGAKGKTELEFGEHSMDKKTLKLILVPFFIIHFGFFCFLHGSFIDSIFGGSFFGKSNLMTWETVWALKYGIAAIFINYSASFLINFIGKQEIRSESIVNLFIGPYQRIVLVHIVIILFGILFIVFLSNTPPYLYILLLFGVKMLMDLRQHSLGPLNENSKIFKQGNPK